MMYNISSHSYGPGVIVFHVSEESHGKAWYPSPRVPCRRMKGEDDKIPRVCVSPTIKQCLLAIDGVRELSFSKIMFDDVGWFVYKTDAEAFYPGFNLVPDSDITNEHWILTKSKFVLVGTVAYSREEDSVYVLYTDGIRENIDSQISFVECDTTINFTPPNRVTHK